MAKTHMSAEAFRNCQDYLGFDIATMAAELRRHRRSVDVYRRDGISDQLVAERVEFLVAEKVARESGILCVTKGCETVAMDDGPYCLACAAEERAQRI